MNIDKLVGEIKKREEYKEIEKEVNQVKKEFEENIEMLNKLK